MEENFSKEAPQLFESHFEQLHKGSGIDKDVIIERGYKSTNAKSELLGLGFSKTQCRTPGMLIPILGTDGTLVGNVLRPDNPRAATNGKPVKYEIPAGSSIRLDCHPRCQKLLSDPSVTLWITEGIKKEDALVSHNLCVIGLSGVYGFKGKNKTGGITFLTDWDLIALNGRKAIIVYDSDVMVKPQVRKALNTLTEHLQRKGSKVFHIILPSDGSEKVGVDDYLMKHPLEDLLNLVVEPQNIPLGSPDETLSSLLLEIESGNLRPRLAIIKIRSLKGVPLHLRRSLISRLVIIILIKAGNFVKNAEGRFYFHSATKQLLELDSFEFGALFSDIFGINPTEPEYKFTLADLNTEAHLRAKESQIYRLSFYDKKNNLLYVDRFDGNIYRLDGKKVELVDNGTDGIVFTKQATWEPYQYIDGSSSDGLFSRLLVDDIPFEKDTFAPIKADEQRIVFALWIFSLFFESLLPTKPILAFIGEKGSGKTTALRRVLRFMFGNRVDVIGLERGKEDAFIATITHNFLVVFDNLDGKIPWINDRLALASTSSSTQRRRLYTTNDVATFEHRCFIGLTSRNPQFKRDDVVDRLILLKVERLGDFRPESKMMQLVISQRDTLWTEIINDLNTILSYLPAISGGPKTKFRMADWADLCWRIAQSQGIADVFDNILKKLSNEQAKFTLEDDPLYISLVLWLEKQDNVGREVDAKTLFNELSNIAESEKLDWNYKSTISFAKRLTNINSNLVQVLGAKEIKDSRGRKYYCFYPIVPKVVDGMTE